MPEHLPAWSQALYTWAQQAGRDIRRGQQVLQALLIVQAVFDVAAMRHAMGPLLGRGAGGSSAFVFVLPGIGGVTAGGAATGARVVISAEWVRAMEHLIAIGAIATPEIVQLAGVSSLPVSAPSPARPYAMQASGMSGEGAGGPPPKETPKAASAEGIRVPSDNAGVWIGKRGDGIFTPKGTDWKIPFRNGRPDFSTFVESGHEFRNVRGLTGKGDRSILLQEVVSRFGQKYGFTTHGGAQRWLSRYRTKYGIGLEMHHSGSGRFQLVPSAVHKAASHGGFKGSASQLRK